MVKPSPDTSKLLCQVGRMYDPAHPTCRSCQIGCVGSIEQAAAKLPSLPDADDVARMRGKITPTEDHEQRIVAQFLDLLGFRWMHCPNEGKRDVVSGARLKASGMKKGCPDILIFDSPPDSDWVGVAIELKRTKGGKISKEQQEWLDALSERGWLTRCCKGSGETIEFLREIYRK